VQAGRKVGKVKAGTNVRPISSARSQNAGARMDKEQATAIREWAKGAGHAISERGRIPAAIMEAYETAHAANA
jgi:hypothetical protein